MAVTTTTMIMTNMMVTTMITMAMIIKVDVTDNDEVDEEWREKRRKRVQRKHRALKKEGRLRDGCGNGNWEEIKQCRWKMRGLDDRSSKSWVDQNIPKFKIILRNFHV